MKPFGVQAHIFDELRRPAAPEPVFVGNDVRFVPRRGVSLDDRSVEAKGHVGFPAGLAKSIGQEEATMGRAVQSRTVLHD